MCEREREHQVVCVLERNLEAREKIKAGGLGYERMPGKWGVCKDRGHEVCAREKSVGRG